MWNKTGQPELMRARRDFTDTEILEVGQCFQLYGKHPPNGEQQFQESLLRSLQDIDGDGDQYLGEQSTRPDIGPVDTDLERSVITGAHT